MTYFTIGGLLYNHVAPVAYIRVNILTSGSFAAIFGQLIPIFTLILSYIFGVEKTKSLADKKLICQMIGTLIGCGFAVGVLFYAFKGASKVSSLSDYIISTLLSLFINIIISVNFVCQTKIFFREEISHFHCRPLTTQAYSVAFGGLIFCIILIPYVSLYYKKFLYMNPKAFISIIYSSFLVAPVSKGLMSFISKKSSPIIVGASYSLSIVTALLLLRIFANESLLTIQYILFIGVIFGVTLVVLSPLCGKKKSTNMP